MTNTADLLRSFNDAVSKIQSFRIETDSMNIKINEQNKAIEEVRILNNIRSEFEELRLIINNHVQADRIRQISQSNKMISLGSDIEKIKGEIRQMTNEQENNRNTILNLQELIHAHVSANEKIFKECKESNHNSIQSLKSEVKALIEKLKSEFLVPPNSILESNETVMKKIESALLDGSNAMIKVNNLELHIRVLEKKQEQILQLLKKIDLTNQAS